VGLEVGRVLERGEEEELVRLLVWEVEEWRMMVIDREADDECFGGGGSSITA